jgi:hypothetical protein
MYVHTNRSEEAIRASAARRQLLNTGFLALFIRVAATDRFS